MNRNFSRLAAAVENRSDSRSHRSCPAGKGFSGAAFPNAHFDRMRVDTLHKLYVCPIREKLMMLDQRPELLERHAVRVLYKFHRMGISDRNQRQPMLLGSDF